MLNWLFVNWDGLQLKLLTRPWFFWSFFSVYAYGETFHFHNACTLKIVVWFWISAYSNEKIVHFKHLTLVYVVPSWSFFQKIWVTFCSTAYCPKFASLHVHFLSSEEPSLIASLMYKLVKLWGASNSHSGQNSSINVSFPVCSSSIPQL